MANNIMPRMEFAQLKTISLSKLASGDAGTIALLYEAAVDDGVFYLEPYLGWQDEPALQAADVAHCLALAKEVFSLPAPELLRCDFDSFGDHRLDGYKPRGRNAELTKESIDGFEAFLMSRKSLCGSPQTTQKLQYPEPIEACRPRMRTLLESLGSIGQVILKAIAAAMKLPPQSDFSLRHRPDHQSLSTFGMLRYPKLSADEAANAGHATHTDEGTLTSLFTSDYGLQLQNAATQRWEFVEPRAEHTVINLGDTLRFMSGGRLNACLHRVTTLPGRTILERYSVAYFMRAEDDACFTDAAGRTWTSIDWHIQKYRPSAGPVSCERVKLPSARKDG